MSLSVGIVGFPNVGKSTLFETLTKKRVDCSNYAFCTIDPNVGVVFVPDFRVKRLADIFSPRRVVYSSIEFTDIAGLVEGASRGEGLGNRFLSHVRRVDAIVYVLRAFEDSSVISTRDEVDPLRESDLLDTELALKDLETVEKRMQKARKENAVFEKSVLFKAYKALESESDLFKQEFSEEEKILLHSYGLLTMKPKIYVLNGSASLNFSKTPFVAMDIVEENQSAGLSPEERVSLGLSEEVKTDELVKKCYELLDLITFFTIGEDEVRAWKTERGSRAPRAGGVIHSDFENKFIKAEVINWSDLVSQGGLVQAKKKGLVRLEGKDYVVQDGDVIEIKHG